MQVDVSFTAQKRKATFEVDIQSSDAAFEGYSRQIET